MTDSAFVVGNGPSLELRVFEYFRGKTWLGMNNAFRHWQASSIYPTHYACLDPVVVASNVEAIIELIADSPIQEFFLHDAVRDQVESVETEKRIVFLQDFVAAEHSSVPMQPKSRDKQTTGSLACRYMLSRGYRTLYLYGIDCSYHNFLVQSVSEGGHRLSIDRTVETNPNYYFDGYQTKGDKYQVPNPAEHSGNLHLQSFVALSDDLALASSAAAVFIGSKESLLYTHGIFQYFDPTLAETRKLQCVAVPLTVPEIPQFLANLAGCNHPNFYPSLGRKRGTVLHLFLDVSLSESKIEELRTSIAQVGIAQSQFDEIRISTLDIPEHVNYYVRPNQNIRKRCEKSGPNVSFLAMLAACKAYQYTLLMETDCVPLRAGWLDSLDAEILANESAWIIGSAYLGPSRLGDANRLHINGNAIYKTGSREFQGFIKDCFVPLLQHVIYEGASYLAYDCLLSHCYHHFSSLPTAFRRPLLDALQRVHYTPRIVNYGGVDETFDPSLLPPTAIIDPRAVVAHGRAAMAITRDTVEGFSFLYSHHHRLRTKDLPLQSIWSSHSEFSCVNEGYGHIRGRIPAASSSGQIAIHFTCPDGPQRWMITCSAVIHQSRPRIQRIEIRVVTRHDGVTPFESRSIFRQDLPMSRFSTKVNWASPEIRMPLQGRLLQILLTTAEGPESSYESEELAIELTDLDIAERAAVNVVAADVRDVVRQWSEFVTDLESPSSPVSPYRDSKRPEHRVPAPPHFASAFSPPCTEVFHGGMSGLSPDGEIYFDQFQKGTYTAACFPIGLAPGTVKFASLEIQASAPCELQITLCRDGVTPFEEATATGFFDKESRTISLALEAKQQHAGFRLQVSVVHAFSAKQVRLRIRSARIDRPSSLAEPETNVKLLSLNADLVDGFGHYLQMDSRLREAATRLGWDFHSLAHRTSTVGNDWVHPTFSAKTYSGPRVPLKQWKELLDHEFVTTFAADLEVQLVRLAVDGRTTIVYSYMTSVAILAALVLVARRGRGRKLRFVCCLSSMFLSVDDLTTLRSPGFLPSLKQAGADSLVFATDLESITDYASPLADQVLHVPMFPLLDAYADSPYAGSRPFSVVYASNSQVAKGFDLLCEFLGDYAASMTGDFSFTARYYPRDSLIDYEYYKSIASVDNVRFVDGPLTDDQYKRLIASADIMVVPYRPATFSHRTSAQVVDAIMSGKPVVASRGTWAGDVVTQFGCGVAYDSSSAKSLRNALLSVRANYKTYVARTARTRDAWKVLYSTDHFLSAAWRYCSRSVEDVVSTDPPTFAKANNLFRQRMYEDALKMYEQLYQDRPFSLYLQNINRCRSLLGLEVSDAQA